MRTKLFFTVVLLLLAITSLSAYATVKVNNLHLMKNGQFTELTIATDSKCEFTHQIVDEPNKPYRIVVDIKDAQHALPQQAYSSFPAGMVKQIRTSQYSTSPENVVRVVVDAVGSLTYKVKAGDNGVTLFISTPSDKDFPMWSAVAGSAPVPTLVKEDTPKNEVPKTMPAAPGNEANAPKLDKTDPPKQDLKLANKPIDEGVLLNKTKTPSSQVSQSQTPAPTASIPTASNKTASAPSKSEPSAESQQDGKTQQPSQPAVVQANPTNGAPKSEAPLVDQSKPATSAQPQQKVVQAPVDPKVLESIYGKKPTTSTLAANTDSKTETAAPAQTKPQTQSSIVEKKDTKAEGQKVVDSSVAPTGKNPATFPAVTPPNMMQPPKAQKSALPDVRVNPKPAFAGGDSVGALDSKLATTVTSDSQTQTSPATTTATEETLAQENADQRVKSKSEIIREKYQATRESIEADKQKALDSVSMAQTDKTTAEPNKIDRIRLKYKRGIKFSQGAEEEQYAYDESDYVEEDAMPLQQVGPYNEFLPEREIVVYNSGGHVDPFEPMVEDAQKSTDYDRIPDVESLRLVGILQDAKSSRALFEDANGYSYILQTGDRVKNGFVLSISSDRVVFQIRQYGWNRQVALDLEESH